jgi:beta-glucanase (GH16 family)
LKFRFAALLVVTSLLAGTASANAVSAVPSATKVRVATTATSAKLTWQAFPTSKISSIKVTAASGAAKISKTIAKTATSYSFTKLKSFTSYTFTVTAFLGSRSGATSTLKAKTKTVKTLLYNSIFFGAPDDMVVGDADQALFALPNGGVTTFSTTTPTRCSITEDNMLHAIAVGECIVVASNAGDSDYLPASPVEQVVNITASIADIKKNLEWADEFDGASNSGPNSANWGITTGDGCGTAAGCGWGNGEAEAYAACANKLDGNGLMVITASTPAGDSNCTSNKTWTSGKFTTYGKKNFGYGYFEARLKMPAGGGTWPAFWTLGSNINSVPWPKCGELDIMEYAGNNPTRTTSAVHYENNGGVHDYKSGALSNSTELSEEFHTYGMLWLPNEITFSFDGRPVLTLKKSDTGLSRWPFGPNAAGVDPKMYIIFNLAMGGNYGGGIESGLKKATFSIDYVRYYSVDGFPSTVTN